MLHQGAKERYFPVLGRGNSSADPPDIRAPAFQRQQLPLVWWPWWPYNPADAYMSSVLPLERMLRERVLDGRVTPVPVLDGLEPPPHLRWWLEPFFNGPVGALPLACLLS
jgi:hypothetical protein